MEAEIVPFHAVRMPKRPRTWRKTFLREWRKFRKKTLESVSAQMGLTHGQLSKVERGLHPYNQHILEVAALEYDCTIIDLLTRSPYAPEMPPPAQRRKAG